MKTMDSLKSERDACEERCALLEAILRELVSDESQIIHPSETDGSLYCAFCNGNDGYDSREHVIRDGFIHDADCLYLRARAALGLSTEPPPIVRAVFPPTT